SAATSSKQRPICSIRPGLSWRRLKQEPTASLSTWISTPRSSRRRGFIGPFRSHEKEASMKNLIVSVLALGMAWQGQAQVLLESFDNLNLEIPDDGQVVSDTRV